MSYFQQNQPNNQHSPNYHQLPPSMIQHSMRAQQTPTSPYTNTSATPTTAHQLSQIRYQQQQSQSPHSHNAYYNMPAQTHTLAYYQQSHNTTQPSNPSPTNRYTHRSPVATVPILPKPQPAPTVPTANPLPPPVPAYSSGNESNQNVDTPQSQRSRFSPTIDAFPDTLPVLDEQQRHTYGMNGTDICSSNENATEKPPKAEGDAGDDEEPIPSDEPKLSTSSSLIEQELLDTASERAFLQQLSQMALDETNQTNEKIVSDLTEIDEQMQLETNTPSPQTIPVPFNRAKTHPPLSLNMAAPVIESLVKRYNKSGSATLGTSPITSPIMSGTQTVPTSMRIKMPNATNMISYSSTDHTPTTNGADVMGSPVTPNRRGGNGSSYYNYHTNHRMPLSVTTTPNSYTYRQRNTNFGSIRYNQPQIGQRTQQTHPITPHVQQTSHRPTHHYPQTPTMQPNTHNISSHNVSYGGTRHHLSLAPNTNLYQSNPYCNLMGSQTPGPNGNRLRSKSATSAAVSQTGSPQFQSMTPQHTQHHGSMTPQHHTRRRHSLYDHSYNSGNHSSYYNKHSRTEKIYNLLQQHGNCMKLSQFTMLYPQQFHEMLPANNRDNNLLKYLVQLPRILVIKCLSVEDIMIFYCETSSHRTVIDILRHSQEIFEKEHANDNTKQYKGMEIEQFTIRLAEKLNIASLSDCNIVDFLERWRVVELVENNKYVRLMPMGSCTVFLGNLNPSKWNENKVRNVLTKINSSWYNLRIRLNQTNYGLLNAFVDFKSMQQAQSAIGLIKNHLCLFESNNANQNYDSQMKSMLQQQQMMAMQQSQMSTPQSPQGIRVEIETSSVRKNHGNINGTHMHSYGRQNTNNNTHNPNQRKINTPKRHSNNTPKKDNSNDNGNSNGNFSRVTNNIYSLIQDEHSGQMLMSCIASEYKTKFGQVLEFDGNPKYFVKMERLLLLNCSASDDVMIFFTPEPAYKLVVTILKQNPSGLTVEQFKTDLERRMSMSLAGCDFNDFLMRWRFLSIRETTNAETKKCEKMVLFTPHSGSTVFFGNLNVECTETDIYTDLERADASWKHSSVRLKLGKGFAYAFVDFPTRNDAMKAVQFFDGKQAFKSKYVSADIEAIEQRKRKFGNNRNATNHKNGHRQTNKNNNRNRSYSNGASPNGTHSNGNGYNSRSHHRPNNGHSKPAKTTVYLGNLRDDVTKSDIQNELRNFNQSWTHLTIRLNLRSGWSHAFVDFELSHDARKLIQAWNNRPNPLTSTRLRCEISKRQM